MSLEDVIARLERATRQDRRLDEEIATAIWGEPEATGNYGEARTLYWWHRGVGRSIAPEFTASIDAALLLLPEGWWLQHLGHNLAGWGARVETRGRSIPDSMVLPRSPTPALALCIACLRAKATAA